MRDELAAAGHPEMPRTVRAEWRLANFPNRDPPCPTSRKLGFVPTRLDAPTFLKSCCSISAPHGGFEYPLIAHCHTADSAYACARVAAKSVNRIGP